MEAKITSIRKNPLLDRNRAEITLEHEGESTPSREDVKNRVAAEEDLDTDKIEVVSIKTGYGKQKSEAVLKIHQQLDEEKYSEKFEEAVPDNGKESDTKEQEDADYGEIVAGTISDAKEALEEMDNPDFEKALEAEKQNKNRKTFIEWLESQ